MSAYIREGFVIIKSWCLFFLDFDFLYHIGTGESRRRACNMNSHYKGVSTCCSTSSITSSGLTPSRLAATASRSLPYCMLLSFSGLVMVIRWGYIFRAARAIREGVTKERPWRGARHLGGMLVGG